MIDLAAQRPLVTITAAAGWGKTTVTEHITRGLDAGWSTVGQGDGEAARFAGALLATLDPDHPATAGVDDASPNELAATVAGAWRDGGPDLIVVDDAHRLGDDTGRVLLQALSRHLDRDRRLLVVSRTDLGLVDDRQRGSGSVLELDATHLALDVEAVGILLERELDPDLALAARLVEATGGWPAAVRLAIDALRQVPASERSAAVEPLTAPEGPIGRYLGRVVLSQEPPAVPTMLSELALLGRADTGQLTSADDGQIDERELVDDLVVRGLIRPDPVRPGVVGLAPVARRYALDRLLPTQPEPDELVDGVVSMLVDDGAIGRGLDVLTLTDRMDQAADLLERHGEQLLVGGSLSAVADAASAVPDDRRSEPIERLNALAFAFQGDWSAAMRCLQAAGLRDDGPLTTPLAVTLGLIHHIRGDLDAALKAYARAPEDEPTPEHVALRSWRATAHWLRGELDDARQQADAAMASATALADDASLAYAHTAQALVAASDGDRRANESHYRQALEFAERAGDGLQQARILTNRGSHHLEEGRYALALEETDRAVDLAETQGFAPILGVARCNRAEILLRTGAIDESIADAERAREVFARIGARTESYAHHLLGAARLERGEVVLARRAYERAIRLAEPAGDRQGLVPAHLGLARALADVDPDAAAAAAERAIALADGMHLPEAQVTAAWVAAVRDDADRARDLAEAAHAEAERRGNLAVSAEALACLATLDDDPLPRLREARMLWHEVESPLWSTRVELAIAQRSSEAGERSQVAWLERRLATLGSPPERGTAISRLLIGGDDRPRTVIRALGGFVVERDGRPVPPSAWGSRKARELLKVLVTLDRRSLTREELAHLLWPDEPYEKVTNRLSVALSVTRSVLAGDAPSDLPPAIRSDSDTIALETEVVEVDVGTFRRLADDGLRATRQGDHDRAIPMLTGAEELYGGDLLEGDPDAAWATDRRVELRTIYLTVTRTLARLVSRDDPDLAIRLLLRVLDRDAYDEPAHLNLCLALLRTGRHGEAQRRYRLYADRMQELDLSTVPFHELQRRLRASDAAEAAG